MSVSSQIYFGLRNHFSIGFGKDHQREILHCTYYLKSLPHIGHCVYSDFDHPGLVNENYLWDTGLFMLIL